MKASKPPKRPTKAEIARLQPLITLCTERLIRCAPNSTHDSPVTVDVVWPRSGEGKPKGFPKGLAQTKRHTETTFTIRYQCKGLLDWFKDNLYVSYGNRELMEQRISMLAKLTVLERSIEPEIKFDIDENYVYNDRNNLGE